MKKDKPRHDKEYKEKKKELMDSLKDVQETIDEKKKVLSGIEDRITKNIKIEYKLDSVMPAKKNELKELETKLVKIQAEMMDYEELLEAAEEVEFDVETNELENERLISDNEEINESIKKGMEALKVIQTKTSNLEIIETKLNRNIDKLDKDTESKEEELVKVQKDVDNEKEKLEETRVEIEVAKIKGKASIKPEVKIITEIKTLDDKNVRAREKACQKREGEITIEEAKIEQDVETVNKKKKDLSDLEKGLRDEKDMFDKNVEQYLKRYITKKGLKFSEI